jgi:subtilisin-like proprotein convertase family protein
MNTKTNAAHRGRLAATISAITLCAGIAAPAFAGPKEDLHAEMATLHAQMQSLKPLINSDQQAATSYVTAESRCAQISAQMGGDLPQAEGGQTSAGGGAIRGTIPNVPTGCTPTTITASNTTPVAIPTGPAVVTSTVIVAGAGPSLWDLNLTTNITHTFAADLDITLQSPAGTVITLTTDNGAGNDNVFNGTVWDDDANPAGQVPYTTNSGVVSDHAYVNLTLASPLVPEEALSAFQGENPNGTWTITISDDLAGDGGSLDSWSMEITTFPSAPITATTNAAQTTPVAIPTGPAVVTSTLAVAGAGTSICKVALTSNITHTFAADLDVTLQSPAGTVITLTTDNGAGNDNVFNGTVWDDDANPAGQVPYTTNNGVVTDHAYVNLTLASPLVVEESMGAFMGEDPNGTWTMTVSDDLAGDGGSLDSWALAITTCTCATPPVFAYAPPPSSTVTAVGGLAIGSTGTLTITPSVATPGNGTGAAATTTTTCTAPTAPFAGFGQSVTAVGAGAISGGPLTGTCTLGAAAVTQTLSCTENRGGVPTAVSWTLECPLGQPPLTSTPPSGGVLTLPAQLLGGLATTAAIAFQNPGTIDATVTCTAPTTTQFNAAPLIIMVPAGGSATTTVSYFNNAGLGTFTGVMNCVGPSNQAFTFNLQGSTQVPSIPVPATNRLGLWLMLAGVLALGLLALFTRRQ